MKGTRKSPWDAEVTDILSDLRGRLEEFLETEIEGAVIGTPAMYGMNQSAALRAAGEAAGFGRVSLIHEPYAAAMHEYAGEERSGHVLVYCLGRSAFSASVFALEKGTVAEMNHEGSMELGGQDFEGLVVQELIREIPRERRSDLSQDRKAMMELIHRTEQAKRRLDSDSEAVVRIGPIEDLTGQAYEKDRRITREEFTRWTAPLVAYTIALSRKAVEGAGLQVGDIDEVLMVGGATYSPHVLSELDRGFDRPLRHAGPESVARGAALYAASKQNCFTPGGGFKRPRRREEEAAASSAALTRVGVVGESLAEKPPPEESGDGDELSVAWRNVLEAQEQDDLSARIAAFENLVKHVFVKLSYLHVALASRMRDAGELDEALKQLEQAEKYQPDNQQAKIVRAGLHIEQAKACVRRNPQRARSHLVRSLELDPDNMKAEAMLRRLEEDLGLKPSTREGRAGSRRSKSHGKKKGRR
jgi:hypothetical protein